MCKDAEPKKYRKTLIFPAALDPDAVKIVRRLKRFGHEAYLVGGCVRDLLLGSIPKDFDVSTSARPRQIRRLFKNSKVIGRRFKLAHIIFGRKIIEVSTFRKAPQKESPSFKSDGLLIVRDNVYGNERDDALRRDFTINSLFYDIEEEEVIDYSGGFEDIQNRLLRTIGDPHIRFQEDPVRILRAIRFSCRLNLAIDQATFNSMTHYANDISLSAPQRVTEEIIRLLSCGAAQTATEKLMEIGLFKILFPEIQEILDQESLFFSKGYNVKQFSLRLLHEIDKKDKGKRRFGNSMYLLPILGHLGGNAIYESRKNVIPSIDPGAILNNLLRPIAIRMGLSRRELSRLKQIIIAYPKISSTKKRRRFKPKELIKRDYFPDALEFYRQVTEAASNSLDRYEWWENQLKQNAPQPRKKKTQNRRSRKRPRKRMRNKPSKEKPNPN